MKVAFHTLGCKLNYSETSAISRQVNGNGYVKVGFEEAADLYVINTCPATGNADKKPIGMRKIYSMKMNENR